MITSPTELLQYTIPVATGFAAFILALVVGIVKFLRRNMSNGDGRTLRKAVDDIADDFRGHRRETNDRLIEISDRIGGVETRMERVESRAAHHR